MKCWVKTFNLRTQGTKNDYCQNPKIRFVGEEGRNAFLYTRKGPPNCTLKQL
jgi:extradiol dioxygenase family protein